MELKDIQAKLDELKIQLEDSLTKKQKDEIALQIKTCTDAIEELKKGQTKPEDIKALTDRLEAAEKALKDNQPVIDAFVKEPRKTKKEIKSFAGAFSDAVEANFDGIAKLEKSKGRIEFEVKDFDVKTVGDMTLGANLSGDQVATYIGVGVLPADLINVRDLIPVRQTATGLAITYREGVGEGAVARQTEGSAKAQVDTDWTEVKLVQRTIAAFHRTSKQMLQDLPFMAQTMPRILMRKYMKKENTLFYADISSATISTANSPSGGDTVQKILNMVKTQRNNGYSASFVLITWDDWYNILISARPSTGTDYSTPGGVVVTPTGDIMVAGVKVIPASWVTASDIQIIDTAYIERVEVDSLKVEYSTEDADNFTKNLVTTRIECRTDLSALLTAAHLNYGTLS